MSLSNIDIEPIDAVLIALDPLDREPILLSRSTQSVACSKSIFNNHCAIMNILLTGSDYHGPISHRYTAYRCRSSRTSHFRVLAFRLLCHIFAVGCGLEPIVVVPGALAAVVGETNLLSGFPKLELSVWCLSLPAY